MKKLGMIDLSREYAVLWSMEEGGERMGDRCWDKVDTWEYGKKALG